ncbi:phospholipase A2 inhibitor and Ly6/PLAUR domain-containing protein-like [Bombina bombina]|uniref:phospholipase A2 inhibitor and Ly6/PLAUR domain-containing protein-like n=1 Tax=Bombina bombina TaxID=8345 RepID=UPI00235A5C9A|nr:phospholipase A2 inhibitor and Ly6/PLAUR domain-containing protein-like [Bombina bombina]
MKVTTSIVFIFCASLAAGNILTCEECYNEFSNSCQGHLVSCSSCLTVVRKDNYTNYSNFMIQKSCSMKQSLCNISYSLTTANFTQNFISSCCDSDHCNSANRTVPSQNTTENGVECPVCLLQDADNCVANETIKCTGLETKCLSFSGRVHMQGAVNQYAFQGCVTENVCNSEDFPTYPITYIQEGFKSNCTDGIVTNHSLNVTQPPQ